IGANATMFSIVDRLLLRPPEQVPHADQIRRITVARMLQSGLSDPWDAISFAAFLDMRDQTSSYLQVAAQTEQTMSLGLGAEARPARAVLASGQYFPMLGTRPYLGRFFAETEDRPPDGTPVVVLSHEFWRSAFGGRREILGEPVRLNGRIFEVIGVAPRGFTGVNLNPIDVWVPVYSAARYEYGDEWATNRGYQMFNAFVRLKPGVNEALAAEDAKRAYQGGHEENRRYERLAVPYLGSLIAARTPGASVGSEGQVAAWLLGVAGIVLLIACANVANLVLARGFRRRAEIALRLAIGVSRPRLLRMLLAESLVMAIAGAGVGLMIAKWGGQLLRSTLLPDTSWDIVGPDWRLLLLTVGLTTLAAIIGGLLPLLRATRTDVAAALHGGNRQVGGAPLRLRTGLLLVQTTLCTALLVGAGLFLRSLDRVNGLDLGVELDRVLLVSVDLKAIGLSEEEQLRFYQEAQRRVTVVPGVEAAGSSYCAPFLCNAGSPIRVPGVDSIPRLDGGGPYFFYVTPGALEAYGARLVRGRLFNEGDRAGSQPVAVITERMARVIWPGQDPIGKCYYADSEDPVCREVIGVVADLHRQAIIEPPFMLHFTLVDQQASVTAPSHLVVRTAAGRSPESLTDVIRRELQAIRPDLPYMQIRPYEEVVSPHLRSWRLGAMMFALFAGLSLVMAAVGLYGVLSYLVTQRTAELGVRAALGATPSQLVQMIVRSGLAAALAGVLLGLLLVVLVGNRLANLLFETSPREPLVLLAAGAVILTVALLASLIPGWRATRVDPISALRAE
ncbi:MAG TPA: ADOP family duplicated permease, partial [Gemmatimonadales bacterium]|nr:ADOP family duplicated permease [Gemmatimonadales bacterium]